MVNAKADTPGAKTHLVGCYYIIKTITHCMLPAAIYLLVDTCSRNILGSCLIRLPLHRLAQLGPPLPLMNSLNEYETTMQTSQ